MVVEFLPSLLTVVEWATVVVTFGMMASGIPLCLSMYKERSTANVPYYLFLISTFLSTLMLQYGLMISNKNLILINLVAVFVWGTYVGIYILVSRSKSEPVFKLFGIIALYFAHLYYLFIQPPDDHVPTIGKYLQIWCTLLSLLPVWEIYIMVQDKSAKSCNIPLLLGGTSNAAVWGLYGFLINDVNIYLPSIPGLTFSFVKFALIIMYGLPGKLPATDATPSAEITGKHKKAETNGTSGDNLRQRK